MRMESPAPGINVYYDIYDAEEFIKLAEKEASKDWPRLEWDRSSEDYANGEDGAASKQSEYRSSLGMSLSTIMTHDELPELKEIQASFLKLFTSIDACVWDYRVIYDLPLNENEPYGLLKYANNAEYRTHWDSGPQNGRVVSLVAYLNDNYEGGELEFPSFGYTYKPQAGSVILFPSNYIYKHSAAPVTSGTKYSLVTWFK
jgi:hypothetical protein